MSGMLGRMVESKSLLVRIVLPTVVLLLLVFLALAGCKPEETLPPVTFLPPGATSSPTKLPWADIPTVTAEPDPDGVELLGVGFGAEGAYINVKFKAPPELAQRWFQGSIYVIDETTGLVYNEVPVMPVVGPLFGKPQEKGQEGYCMLTNTGAGIRPGSVVTVVLGSYKREHVKVL